MGCVDLETHRSPGGDVFRLDRSSELRDVGAGGQRQLLPGREARELSGQVDHDTPSRNNDACRQLEQPIPDRADLRVQA